MTQYKQQIRVRDSHYDAAQLVEEGRAQLTTLITSEKLKKAVVDQSFIKFGAPSSVEGVKYDFRMGSRILKASFGQPIDLERLSEQERTQMKIEAGEVVFALTMESLDLPKNIVAVLSPKRKLSHHGIIALGGFCIDPLYKGPLWIGLYNFSSTAFPLKPGRKLIAALFYELSGDELSGEFPVPESAGEDDFPDELVTLIKNYRPIELKALSDSVAETQKQLESLKSDLLTDRDWRREFKESLDEHNRQLGLLIEGLKDEKDVRRKEDEVIRTRIDSVEQRMGGIWATLTSGFRVGYFILALILGALISYFGPKILAALFG